MHATAPERHIDFMGGAEKETLAFTFLKQNITDDNEFHPLMTKRIG